MAKHKPKQFWIAHVEAAQASRMSKVDYCRQHGLDYKTLLRWVGRLRRRGDSAPPVQSLIPVAIRQTAPADRATLTLRIGSDVSLSMPASTDSVWLASLMRAVSSC